MQAPRVTPIVRDTLFEAAWFTALARPPERTLVVVVKATWRIEPDGTCTLLPEQPVVSGQKHHDDDPEKSVRDDGDFAVFKPKGECTLVGTCHAPGGKLATLVGVAFECGDVKRSLAVFGDRVWTGGMLSRAPSPATPFVQLPLRWERAFGAPGNAVNPVGIGTVEMDTPEGKRMPLPNIELPQTPMTSPGDRPAPAGFGPIARHWPFRALRTGTYDFAWARTRRPFPPENFDWAHFNCAPPEQQIEGYWRGDEAISLQNLHVERAQVRTRLAGRRPRVYLGRTQNGITGLKELKVVLDTIAIDTDTMTVKTLWRGVTQVSGPSLPEVDVVFVVDDTLDRVPTPAEVQFRFQSRIAANRLPPEEAPIRPAPGELRTVVTEKLARRESLAGLDLTGAQLNALDLSGVDLTGALLDDAQLQGSRLDGATLTGASFANADLTGASLRQINAPTVMFRGAKLERADLSYAMLDGANLAGAVLDGAKLDGASLVRAAVFEASLVGVSMLKANAMQAMFSQSDLSRADMRGANLHAIETTGAKLDGARLELAIVTHTQLGSRT